MLVGMLGMYTSCIAARLAEDAVRSASGLSRPPCDWRLRLIAPLLEKAPQQRQDSSMDSRQLTPDEATPLARVATDTGGKATGALCSSEEVIF